MKKLGFLLLFAAAPLVAADLRVFNPGDAAAVATITCAGGTTTSTLAPHALADFDNCSAQSAAPLLVLRTGTTDGVEWQILQTPLPAPRGEGGAERRMRGAIHTNDACVNTAPLLLPLNGCRFGTAVAAVAPVDGATYSWSLDGGSILSGTGTERILIAIDGGATLRVTASIAKDSCTTTAAGVMALRDQFLIKSFDAGTGPLGTPRTITWSYTNGEPGTQVLSGTDFPEPLVLPPAARSYTFTPQTGGDRQIVLQASLSTLVGHGRAASSGGGGASSCGQARAQTSYHIDCVRPDVTISAPSSVGTGKPFTVSVSPHGSNAAWTITNGTPATATGESVTITPTGTQPVDISVTVTANGGCSATATAHVVVNQACDNPTATMYVARNDCDAAVVQARFTGTPPFRGTWENGQTFLTSDNVIDRPVTASGTYSVQNFTDAVCGASGSSVSINVKTPSVALTAPNGFCVGPSTTAAATFSGAPPFAGTWSDGVTFSTSSKTITRSVTKGGPLSMTWSDASCSNKTSPALPFLQPATASLDFGFPPPSCVYGQSPLQLDLDVTVTGGKPPYKVTWWDNKVQTANESPIVRKAWTYETPNGAFAIKSVQDASCDAVITRPAVSVVVLPAIDLNYSDFHYVCPGQTVDVYNFGGVPTGATVHWAVTGGTMTAGQGTWKMTFVAGASGSATVQYDLTFGGCTNTATVTKPIGPPPATVTVTPTTLPVGGRAIMTFKLSSDITSYTVLSSTIDQPVPVGLSSGYYTYTFTPTVAGDVTLTVRVKAAYCSATSDTNVKLTVN